MFVSVNLETVIRAQFVEVFTICLRNKFRISVSSGSLFIAAKS